MRGSMYRIDRSWGRSVVMLTEAVKVEFLAGAHACWCEHFPHKKAPTLMPGSSCAFDHRTGARVSGSSLGDRVSPVHEQPYLSRGSLGVTLM